MDGHHDGGPHELNLKLLNVVSPCAMLLAPRPQPFHCIDPFCTNLHSHEEDPLVVIKGRGVSKFYSHQEMPG